MNPALFGTIIVKEIYIRENNRIIHYLCIKIKDI